MYGFLLWCGCKTLGRAPCLKHLPCRCENLSLDAQNPPRQAPSMHACAAGSQHACLCCRLPACMPVLQAPSMSVLQSPSMPVLQAPSMHVCAAGSQHACAAGSQHACGEVGDRNRRVPRSLRANQLGLGNYEITRDPASNKVEDRD